MTSARLLAAALACVSCTGKVIVDPDAATSDGAGAACLDPAAVNDAPTCVPGDGGFVLDALPPTDPECQQWADKIVAGSNAFCLSVNHTTECEYVLVAPSCDPGPDGDAQCQAWMQAYSRTLRAHGVCAPLEHVCIAATKCTVDSTNTEDCQCGSTGMCPYAGGNGLLPRLCLDVGGSPTCAPACQ